MKYVVCIDTICLVVFVQLQLELQFYFILSLSERNFASGICFYIGAEFRDIFYIKKNFSKKMCIKTF